MIVRRLRGAIARAVLKEASDGSKESEGKTAPVQRERTDCRYMSLGAGCGRRRPEDHFLSLYSGVFSHAREIVPDSASDSPALLAMVYTGVCAVGSIAKSGDDQEHRVIGHNLQDGDRQR